MTNEIVQFQFNTMPDKENFETFLTEAKLYTGHAQGSVQAGLGGFQEFILPPSDKDMGGVLAIYHRILNVFGKLMRSGPIPCQSIFKGLSPEHRPKENNGPLAKLAFHQTPAKRDTTGSLHKEILGFYKAY